MKSFQRIITSVGAPAGVAFTALAILPTVRAELPVKRVLTLNVARKIADAAEVEASRRNLTAVIVVVDDGGHLLVLHRTDNTQVASVEVGIGKARTAAIFRRPSKDFEDQVREGRVAALALPGATPLQGGIPIKFDGKVIGAAGAAAAEAAIAAEPATGSPAILPTGTPAAMIDLATDAGVQLVKGQWRYHDTKIVDADFRGPGPEGRPTGSAVKTYDYTPHAGGATFDDSNWEAIGPTTLEQRRANGRICFNWYRIGVTIPERIGDFDTAGSTVAFENSLTITPKSGWMVS